MINIENMTKASVVTLFERTYTELRVTYGHNNVQCLKITSGNKKDYVILVKDLRFIGSRDDYNWDGVKYFLIEKLDKDRFPVFQLLTRAPIDGDDIIIYGIVLTHERYNPGEISPQQIEFYDGFDPFGKMVDDINCEAYVHYTNVGIRRPFDYGYIDEAILTVMSEVDGVKFPVSYDVCIVAPDLSEKRIPSEYSHLYISRSYAFMNRPGETPLISADDFSTYMVLDDVEKTKNDHEQYSQEIMNNEGYFHDEAHTLFEIVTNERNSMGVKFASKEPLPIGNVVINIRYKEKNTII